MLNADFLARGRFQVCRFCARKCTKMPNVLILLNLTNLLQLILLLVVVMFVVVVTIPHSLESRRRQKNLGVQYKSLILINSYIYY